MKHILFGALLISLCALPTYSPHEWVFPEGKKAVTIFYQGILSSQTHVTKYMVDRPITTTTHEQVVSSRGIDVILKPFIGAEISSVQLHRPRTAADYFWPTTWIQCIQEQIYKAKESREGIKVTTPISDQPSVQAHAINWGQTDFGQLHDITDHRTKWRLCKKEYPHHPTILWGVSRGAATTLNSACLHPHSYKHVRLIILEGCFDSMSTVIKNLSPRGIRKWAPQIAESLLTWVTSYKKNFLNPIQLVDSFPQNIPILFVTSKADQLINYKTTSEVAHKLAQKNQNNVYLLTLDHSSHAAYTMTHQEDQIAYQSVVHTLYKKYDLPYIPAYAHDESFLAQYLIA